MPPDNENISTGELSRRVSDVLVRFQGIVSQLETQFVRRELFEIYRETMHQTHKSLADKIAGLDADKAEKTTIDALESRLGQLEDDKKWLIRVVGAFIILGVLALLFAASNGGLP